MIKKIATVQKDDLSMASTHRVTAVLSSRDADRSADRPSVEPSKKHFAVLPEAARW
jgi:hypothetical protein